MKKRKVMIKGKTFVVVWMCLSFLLIGGTDAGAASDEVMKEIRALKKRIEQLEQKLSEQDKKIEQQEVQIAGQNTSIEEIRKIKDAIGGLEFSVGATSVIQGTVNNDRNLYKVPGIDEKGDDADATYSVDIEITSKVGDNGMALLYLEAGEGDGINSEAGGLTGANADAPDDDADVQVSEVWYEHAFMNEKLVATIGKMDATRWFDANEVANDETTQFLSGQFVNNIAVEFPDYSYGARVSWYPTDLFELHMGYLEADGDFEDLFDDNFYIVEFGLKPTIGDLQGNYRFYAWRNSGEHTKLLDAARSNKSGEGFGVSFDQQFSEHITAFARWGIQDHDIYAVHHAWSVGFQVAGGLWGRDEDMFGLAFGRAQTTHDYRDLLRDAGFGTTPAESRLEAYYRCQLDDHIAISPDLQWVEGLAGSSNADQVYIFGVRAQLDF